MPLASRNSNPTLIPRVRALEKWTQVRTLTRVFPTLVVSIAMTALKHTMHMTCGHSGGAGEFLEVRVGLS